MSKERISELAGKIVNTVSTYRPKGLTERAIPAINGYIGEWLEDVKEESPSNLMASELKSGMNVRDPDGEEFTIVSASPVPPDETEQPSVTVRWTTEAGDTGQTDYDTTTAFEVLKGGSRKRRYRRKTLRRKK